MAGDLSESDADMKNILMIVEDCARAEKTVCEFSQATPETVLSARLPFFNFLRQQGATWTCLQAVSSTTTPNFASIFTGLLPCEHGIIEHSRYSLRDDLTTLPNLLREKGYHTYAEVTGPLIPEAGLNKGFEHYRYRQRTEYLHKGFLSYLKDFLPALKQPWYLCLHLWEAHDPYQNPAPFNTHNFGVTAYDRALSCVDHHLAELFASIKLHPATLIYTSDHGERLGEDYLCNQKAGGTEWRVLQTYHQFLKTATAGFSYDRWFDYCASALGDTVARIYAHNVVGHGFHLTEDLIRVPLVIVDTELFSPGSRIDTMRSQLDLFKTICTIAEVDQSIIQQRRGVSLTQEHSSDTVYIEANGSGGKQYASRCYLRGARRRNWKYWYVEGGTEEYEVLWDLDNDPRETCNCLAQHADIGRELRQFVNQQLNRARGESIPMPDDEKARRIEEKMRELGYM